MARTQVTGLQVLDSSIGRPDLITNITGTAVITKLVAGTGVSITSTGIDAGTGDVTVNFTGTSAVTSVFGRSGAVVKAVGDYNFTDLAGSLAATQAPAFTGDATSVAGAVALTLATVNANVGTFNTLTVNAKGLVTAASNVAGAVASVFGRTGAVVKAVGDYNFTDLAGSLSAAQHPALTGDATSVAGALALTLATVNANVGTFNSVTVNAKGLVTAASLTTTLVTGPLNATANTGYVDNTSYYGYATVANGFPVAGPLSGTRFGVIGSQRLQSETGGATYARAWTNATLVWTAWTLYLDGEDFTAKGQLHVSTAPNAYNMLSVGADGTVLTATSANANGLAWASSLVLNTTGTSSNITGVLNAASHPALTGDVTNTAGSLLMTLATVNANVGVFNSVTVNAKGLVTAATNVAAPVTSVFGRTGAVVKALNDYNFTDLAGSLSAAQHPALTGDITSAAGSLATTLATVNANVGTFNSVTVNAKGLVTSATLTTSQITAPTAATANTGYVDNTLYYGYATVANGFPVAGSFSGSRFGVIGAQRLQSELGGATYARAWLNATLVWTAWTINLDGEDFTAKGQLHVSTASNAYNMLSVGADGTVLTAASAGANGLSWATSLVLNTTGTASNITGVLGAASHPALSGDISNPAGSLVTTLATVNANVGVFNSVTVNAKGLVTAASNVANAVTSVFGRTGAVVKALNDYNFTDLAGSLSAAQHPALTGDATSVAGALALTLATVNANVGVFNSVTVNAKGLVTAATNVTAPVTSVFGRTGAVVKAVGDYNFTDLAGTLAATQAPALTGDVTTVAGAVATTLATVNANVGVFNSVTVNAKGLVTAASNVTASVTSVFGRSGVVVKAVGDYNFTDLAGSLAAAQAPALTGDITTAAGSLATILATVNANVGTFNSVTVNAKGLVTAATAVTSLVTGPLNATANTGYADNTSYYGYATVANGFPVAGPLTGSRFGVIGAQRLQSELGGATYARAWLNATAVWTTWTLYLDGEDFAAKGQIHAGTGVGTFNMLSVGADGTVLTASSAAANGLAWASSLTINTTGTSSNITGVLGAASHPALTGDITSVAGSLATTLATVNANVGVFNSVTVNAKGLVTAATNVASAVTSVFGRTGAVVKAVNDYNFTDLAGTLSAAQHPALTGDATSVAGALVLTLATVNANVGVFNSVTVNAKGLVTAASNVVSAVTSIFGRTGAVVKAVGDYNFTDLAGSLAAAQAPALTGDVTTVAGALATTLATVNANVGVFNSVTVNAKGLVTAATNVAAPAAPVSSVFGRTGAVVKAVGDYNFTDLAGTLSAAQHPALTGDATSVAGAVALTLATVNANVGVFNSVTVNAKGLVTAASNVVSAVTSIFGRTGAVVKAVGDYNFTDLAGTLSAAQHPALTGDATSVAGALALTLATVNANVGTFNSVTVNAKGLITAATNVAAPGAPVSSVFGRTGAVVKAVGDYNFTDLAGTLSAAQHPALTGDATSVAGALQLTFNTVNPNVGTFNSVTVNAKGLVVGATVTNSYGSQTSTYYTGGVNSWVKPPGAKWIQVVLQGAGGGGGGGAMGGTGGNRGGGGGGGGGGRTSFFMGVAALAATTSVYIGSGGTGGSGTSVAGGSGTAGNPGTVTQFVGYLAYPGYGGGGGNAAGSAGGSFGRGLVSDGGSGAAASLTSGGTGLLGNTSNLGAPGGGSGGSGALTVAGSGGPGGPFSTFANAGAAANGGAGGAAGAAGVGGTYDAPGINSTGGGGGGGANAAATNGGVGGGGTMGSGAGGGGAGTDGVSNSGAGGLGGDGYVMITCFF